MSYEDARIKALEVEVTKLQEENIKLIAQLKYFKRAAIRDMITK